MRPVPAIGLLIALFVFPTIGQERSEATWGGEFRSGRLHLNMRIPHEKGYSNYGRTLPLSELSSLQRTGRDVSFELQRPAGHFRFEGTGNSWSAAGSYVFTPNAAFRRAMESVGFVDLNLRRMFTLAVHNITLDDVRYLQSNVRGGVNTAQLLLMLDHDAGPEFVRSKNRVAGRMLTVDELVRIRAQH